MLPVDASVIPEPPALGATLNLPLESIVTSDSPFKVLAVPEPVITLSSALLFIVVPAGILTVSKVGSAPLFARKNLPLLDDVPCGSLDKDTA